MDVSRDGLEPALRAAVAEELQALVQVAEQTGRPIPSVQSQRLAGRAKAAEEMERWTAEAVSRGDSPLTDDEEKDLIARVLERLFSGTVGLDQLLSREDVTDIFVNGWDDVRVWTRDGAEERVAPVVSSDEEVIELVRTLGHRAGHLEREFTPAAPLLDLQLAGGARLAAMAWVSDRPYISLRRHSGDDMDLDELQARGMFDAGLATLMGALVGARQNLIICGPAGVGKTTLLRALLFTCDDDERIIVLEDEPELQLGRSRHLNHVVSAFARGANTEGAGTVSLADLSRATKRHRPLRVVVGEVRGEEVVDMMEAITQGVTGSMCTIHAETAAGLFQRIGLYAKHYPIDRIPSLVAVAVDVVIVLGTDTEGRRAVSEVLLVDDRHDPELHQPRTHPLFVRDRETGRAVPNPTSPMPVDLLDELAGHGYDPSLHTAEQAS